jgi:DNA-binding protein HU-beta
MKRKELVDVVAEKTGLSKGNVGVMLDETLATIVEALKADDKVQILGFGTFSAVHRPARTMTRPGKPGETMDVAAKTGTKFKPATALKNL